jgi:hypothetical protein
LSYSDEANVKFLLNTVQLPSETPHQNINLKTLLKYAFKLKFFLCGECVVVGCHCLSVSVTLATALGSAREESRGGR